VTPALASAEFHLSNPADTDRLGRALAAAIEEQFETIHARGLQLNLSGELGAGKTALVRAVLRGLGEAGPVKSPTFSLLEPYTVSSLDFYHFDFYRLGSADEFASAGFRDHFGPGRICAIEWPERAAGRLPAADLTIGLRVEGTGEEAGRHASVTAWSELGRQCLTSAHRRMEAGGN